MKTRLIHNKFYLLRYFYFVNIITTITFIRSVLEDKLADNFTLCSPCILITFNN